MIIRTTFSSFKKRLIEAKYAVLKTGITTIHCSKRTAIRLKAAYPDLWTDNVIEDKKIVGVLSGSYVYADVSKNPFGLITIVGIHNEALQYVHIPERSELIKLKLENAGVPTEKTMPLESMLEAAGITIEDLNPK
jgi:hypothetical protein